jgi:hypothetical protein
MTQQHSLYRIGRLQCRNDVIGAHHTNMQICTVPGVTDMRECVNIVSAPDGLTDHLHCAG